MFCLVTIVDAFSKALPTHVSLDLRTALATLHGEKKIQGH